MSEQVSGKMTIYACGGGGINICKVFAKSPKGNSDTADIETVFIDTSRANLSNDIEQNQLFLLPDADGSGMLRTQNLKDLVQYADPVLAKRPPEGLSVVVFTAMGGTGSVMGSVLVNKLMAAGKDVVAVVVGGDDSGISAKNTFDTLKGLENCVKQIGRTLAVAYVHQTFGDKRSDSDHKAQLIIAGLSKVASRKNRELDTMDVSNWLLPERFHPELGPVLALMNIHFDHTEIDAMETTPLAMLSLCKDVDDPKPTAPIRVSKYGYYNSHTEDTTNMHLTIGTGEVAGVLKRLLKAHEDYERTMSVTKAGPSMSADSDTVDDTTGFLVI